MVETLLQEAVVQELLIADIRRDGGTQARCELDEAVIAEYAELMAEGHAFPPITVFEDEVDYWLADGFHRLAAAEQVGYTTIEAEVIPGTLRHAIVYAVGTNSDHGLRRTNADKRHVVQMLLADPIWSKWSNREIARQCAVSPGLVDQMRQELSAYHRQMDSRLAIRNGTTYEQHITNIGKARRQYIAQNAPPPIQQRVEQGDLAVNTAYELTLALEAVSEEVRRDCIEAGVSDPELVRLVEAKQHTETFQEIMGTGWIQFGEEHEAVPLSQATARDLQRLLDLKSREHKFQAIEARRARQTTLVSADAILTVIGDNEITIQFADIDLSPLKMGTAVRVNISTEQAIEAGEAEGSTRNAP